MKKRISIPVLSLNAKVEQIANLLRKQVQKPKKRRSYQKDYKTPVVNQVNAIMQISRLIREEIHRLKKTRAA